MRTHRVGSVTFGVTLIVSGILFLLHMLVPAITYLGIIKFWPVIFILLGAEVLISNKKSEAMEFKYDVWAIVLVCMMMMFAMGMAGCELLVEYGQMHM